MLSQEQIAANYGVSRRTVSGWLQDERVREAYEMGRARAIKEVATSLLNAAQNGNITAMIFYLKAQAKWSERVEVVERDAEGNPLRSRLTRSAPSRP